MAFVIWDIESVCSNKDAIYINVVVINIELILKYNGSKKRKVENKRWKLREDVMVLRCC